MLQIKNLTFMQEDSTIDMRIDSKISFGSAEGGAIFDANKKYIVCGALQAIIPYGDDLTDEGINKLKAQGVVRVIAFAKNEAALAKRLENSGLEFQTGFVFDGHSKPLNENSIIFVCDFDEKLLSAANDLAAKEKRSVYIDLPCNLTEIGKINSMYNLSPVALLEDIGILDRDVTLVGCCHLDKADEDIISATGPKLCVFASREFESGNGFFEFNFMESGQMFTCACNANGNLFKEFYILSHVTNFIYRGKFKPNPKLLMQLNSYANRMWDRSFVNSKTCMILECDEGRNIDSYKISHQNVLLTALKGDIIYTAQGLENKF